jgi:hypothetical protein
VSATTLESSNESTTSALATTASSNTSASDNEIPILPVWISQVAALTVVGTILLLTMCGCAVCCCVRVVWPNVKCRARRGQAQVDKSLPLSYYAL